MNDPNNTYSINPSNIEIVLADVKDDQRAYFVDFLKENGFQVIEKDNWEHALEYCRSSCPSVLITSASLTGWEILCKGIKDTPKINSLPIIVLGDLKTPEEQNLAESLGVSEYIPDSKDKELFLTHLRSILSRSSGSTKKDGITTKSRISASNDLARKPLLDILQSIDKEHATGCLCINNQGMEAKIFFTQGKVCNAILDDYTGKEAFYRLLSWKKGSFTFDSGPFECDTVIDEDNSSLLLEGIRLQDDLKRLKKVMDTNQFDAEFPFVESLVIKKIASEEKILEAIETKKENGLPLGKILDEMGIFISQETNESKKAATSKTVKENGKETSRTQRSTTSAKRGTGISQRRSKGGTSRFGTGTTAIRKQIEDTVIKRIILSCELLTLEQIQECIDEMLNYQQTYGVAQTLSQIILKKGYLSEETLENLTHLRDENSENLIPGYEVIEKVGEGALSIVYRGVQESLNRYVAIKVFVPGMAESEESVNRFMREGETASKLDHPNIVKAIDFGSTCGFYYFVMEFLEGQTLDEYVKQKGSLSENEALSIIHETAKGLVHIWKSGIVHRDIKPRNIMLTKAGVKICDLGLAKNVRPDNYAITAPGMVLGTPRYMAPEAFIDPNPGFRSDAYSLGMTLYEMITGKTAFTETTPSAVLAAQQTSQPQDPRIINQNISKPLSALILKLLDKNPTNRCQEPDEMLEDIQSVQNGRLPKRLPKYRKPISTPIKTILIGMPIMLFIASLVVIAIMYIQSQNIQKSQKEAQVKAYPTLDPMKEEAKLMVAKGDQYKQYGENAFSINDFETASRFFSEALVSYGLAEKQDPSLNVLKMNGEAISMKWLDATQRLYKTGEPQNLEKALQCSNYGLIIQDCPAVIKNVFTQMKSQIQQQIEELQKKQETALKEKQFKMELEKVWLASPSSKDEEQTEKAFDVRTDLVLHIVLKLENSKQGENISYKYEGNGVQGNDGSISDTPENGQYHWLTPLKFNKKSAGDYTLYLKISKESISISREISFTLKELAEDLIYKGINAQGYEEYLRTRDNMVMILIPAGEFAMGDSTQEGYIDESKHTVYLDSFLIDKYEVSNEQYGKFLSWWNTAWKHEKSQYDWKIPPECKITYDGNHIPHYWDNPKYNKPDFPVVGVDWFNAYAYAKWANMGKPNSEESYLATEAQWEKAASWDKVLTRSRIYPWGDKPDPSKANSRESGLNGVVTVNSYPDGISPFGVHNMAGNVGEWTRDWYDRSFYESSPKTNPVNDKIAKNKVIRGGSFTSTAWEIRNSRRNPCQPILYSVELGFRCVRYIEKK